jgi:hypothetical protein
MKNLLHPFDLCAIAVQYYFGISYILGSVFNNADFVLELYVLKSAALETEPVGT